jgi:hypothetical protein
VEKSALRRLEASEDSVSSKPHLETFCKKSVVVVDDFLTVSPPREKSLFSCASPAHYTALLWGALCASRAVTGPIRDHRRPWQPPLRESRAILHSNKERPCYGSHRKISTHPVDKLPVTLWIVLGLPQPMRLQCNLPQCGATRNIELYQQQSIIDRYSKRPAPPARRASQVINTC